MWGRREGWWVLGTDESSSCLSTRAASQKDSSQHYRTAFLVKFKKLKRSDINKQPFEDSGGVWGLVRQVSLLPWSSMGHLGCWAPRCWAASGERGPAPSRVLLIAMNR